jgi:hypothetical protein
MILNWMSYKCECDLDRTAQNYWVFGLFPSSGILENRKLDLFPSSGEGGRKDIYSVGPLR